MFEDDGVQVCCEVDLISKIAVRIWKAGYNHSSSGSGSDSDSASSSAGGNGDGSSGDNSASGSGGGSGSGSASANGSSSGSKHSQYIITAVTTLCTAGIHRSKTQNQNSIRNLCGELNENENENDDMLESTFQSTLYTACRDSLIYLETEILSFLTGRNTDIKSEILENNDNNDCNEKFLKLKALNLSEGGRGEGDVNTSALDSVSVSVSVSSIFAVEFIDSKSSNSDLEMKAVIDLMKSYLRV